MASKALSSFTKKILAEIFVIALSIMPLSLILAA